MIILDSTCHTETSFRGNFWPSLSFNLNLYARRSLKQMPRISCWGDSSYSMSNAITCHAGRTGSNAIRRGAALDEKENGSQLSLIIGVKNIMSAVEKALLRTPAEFASTIFEWNFQFFMEEYIYIGELIWQMQFSTPSFNFPHRFISLFSFKYLMENSTFPPGL